MHRRNRRYRPIEPDEILIDAENLPGFDPIRLEGKIEKAIEPKAMSAFALIAFLIGAAFLVQLVRLQVVDAAALTARAEANRLDQEILVAERGVITDRRGAPLAENAPGAAALFATRVYPLGEAAAHLIGYVSYPKKDKNGYWIEEKTKGLSGIEASFDRSLTGENGVEIRETDATGNLVSGSTVRGSVRGSEIALSIDAGLQRELYEAIRSRAIESGFAGGSGALMDLSTGEVYALASYPSFDPELVSSGGSDVADLLSDPRAPFLDRAISGLYAPGSVVKPMVAAAALQEGIITPEKKLLSTGSITVPNPYNPDLPSVFKDWKAHGWVDMRRAIAVSSDVYFYEIGGGFSAPGAEDQPGLGIALIKKYLTAFGLGLGTGIDLPGEASGLIPDPAWKASAFDGERWLLGDTYHTAIGQYGFQVTTIELARAAAAIGNGGTLVVPTLVKDEEGERSPVGVLGEHLAVVREGMLLATKPGGTAAALDLPGLAVGGKTGTAQVGVRNEFMNSTVIGFFPYEKPRYAFAIVMERARAGTQIGAPAVMAQVLRFIAANLPDMLH